MTWLENQIPSTSSINEPKPTKGGQVTSLPIYMELVDFVAKNPGTCDDCISDTTEIKPRQRIYYYLRRLLEEGIVDRTKGICPGCGGEKTITFPLSVPGEENP